MSAIHETWQKYTGDDELEIKRTVRRLIGLKWKLSAIAEEIGKKFYVDITTETLSEWDRNGKLDKLPEKSVTIEVGAGFEAAIERLEKEFLKGIEGKSSQDRMIRVGELRFMRQATMSNYIDMLIADKLVNTKLTLDDLNKLAKTYNLSSSEYLKLGEYVGDK